MDRSGSSCVLGWGVCLWLQGIGAASVAPSQLWRCREVKEHKWTQMVLISSHPWKEDHVELFPVLTISPSDVVVASLVAKNPDQTAESMKVRTTGYMLHVF